MLSYYISSILPSIFFKLYHAGLWLESINLQLCSSYSPRAQVHYVHGQPGCGPSTYTVPERCYDYSCLTCCTIGSSACSDNSAVMFTVLAALAITSHYIILITQTLTFEWYYVQNSGTEKKGSLTSESFIYLFSQRTDFSQYIPQCVTTTHCVFSQNPWKTLEGPASARNFLIKKLFLIFQHFHYSRIKYVPLKYIG